MPEGFPNAVQPEGGVAGKNLTSSSVDTSPPVAEFCPGVGVGVDAGADVSVGVAVGVGAGADVSVAVGVGVGVAVTEAVLLHELADITKVSNSATTSALHKTFLILSSQYLD